MSRIGLKKKHIIIPQSKRENAIEAVLPFVYLRYATYGSKYISHG